MLIDCAGKILSLDSPNVMGILNVTPDSFSDGGRYASLDEAADQAWRMVEEGAAIIDIGGESTRPGAMAVEVDEELRRVIPLIERLSDLPVPLSIDTSKPQVMREAVSAGAGFINDVCALTLPGALEAAAEAGVPICLMHMQGEPRTMQLNPHYRDVVGEVSAFLSERVDACVKSGIDRSRILVDPGIGFGKTLDHNLALLRHLGDLAALGLPLLVGVSRKSFIGALLGGAPVTERVNGSLAAAVIAAWQGAHIIRAHDVRATVEALKVTSALRGVQ